jgi:octaprenyl-diphosphate synthase
MVEFQQEALLLENYNHSDFKEALILMVNYVIERKIKLLMSWAFIIF